MTTQSMVLISSRGLVLEFVECCTIDFLCVPLLSGNMVSRVEKVLLYTQLLTSA